MYSEKSFKGCIIIKCNVAKDLQGYVSVGKINTVSWHEQSHFLVTYAVAYDESIWFVVIRPSYRV